MRITCISASNVEPARERSASSKACELIRDLVASEGGSGTEVGMIRLLDLEPSPCRMCGACLGAGRCARDEAFNQVHSAFIGSDAVFLVCPHYAPFPSKLMMLLEKMQEMWYLNWCRDNAYRAPYQDRPLGLVAHGGQGEEALPYYRRALLDPLASAFSSVRLKPIPAGEDSSTGAVFGIKSIAKPADSVFVTIEHDWDDVRSRLAPLVKNVLAAVGKG